MEVQFHRIKPIIADKWKENYDQMSKQVIKWNLNNILALRRNNKFNRDKLDYELEVTISSNKLKNLQNNKNLKEDLWRKILAGQNISTYEPLNLQKVTCHWKQVYYQFAGKAHHLFQFHLHIIGYNFRKF